MKKRNLRYMTEEWRARQSQTAKEMTKKHTIEVTCDRCGETYNTYDFHYEKKEHHCCAKCRNYLRQKELRKDLHMYKHKCTLCGKEYESTRKNIKYGYCSDECRKKAFTITCKTCGKKFISKRPEAKYCCKDCFYKSGDFERFRNGHKGKEVKDTYTGTCSMCGKPTKENKTFCSVKCYNEYRKAHKNIRYCIECGKPITNTNKRFCSMECQENWQEKRRIEKYGEDY